MTFTLSKCPRVNKRKKAKTSNDGANVNNDLTSDLSLKLNELDSDHIRLRRKRRRKLSDMIKIPIFRPMKNKIDISILDSPVATESDIEKNFLSGMDHGLTNKTVSTSSEKLLIPIPTISTTKDQHSNSLHLDGDEIFSSKTIQINKEETTPEEKRVKSCTSNTCAREQEDSSISLKLKSLKRSIEEKIEKESNQNHSTSFQRENVLHATEIVMVKNSNLKQAATIVESGENRKNSTVSEKKEKYITKAKFNERELFIKLDDFYLKADVHSVTVKQVIQALEAEFGVNLRKKYRKLIKLRLTQLISGKIAPMKEIKFCNDAEELSSMVADKNDALNLKKDTVESMPPQKNVLPNENNQSDAGKEITKDIQINRKNNANRLNYDIRTKIPSPRKDDDEKTTSNKTTFDNPNKKVPKGLNQNNIVEIQEETCMINVNLSREPTEVDITSNVSTKTFDHSSNQLNKTPYSEDNNSKDIGQTTQNIIEGADKKACAININLSKGSNKNNMTNKISTKSFDHLSHQKSKPPHSEDDIPKNTKATKSNSNKTKINKKPETRHASKRNQGRTRKGVCSLCKTCQCQRLNDEGIKQTFGELEHKKTDIEVEKLLIKRKKKLEKTVDKYESDLDLVSRHLKKHRRMMLKRKESELLSGKTLAFGNSHFLPDVGAWDSLIGDCKKLPLADVHETQRKIFGKVVGAQPTLTQMYGENSVDDDELSTSSLIQAQNDKERDDLLFTDEDSLREDPDDINNGSNIFEEPADNFSRISWRSGNRLGAPKLWEQPIWPALSCGRGGSRGESVDYTAWDDIFSDDIFSVNTNDDASNGFEELLNLFGSDTPHLSAPDDDSDREKENASISLSQLSQPSQKVAVSIENKVIVNPKMLSNIQASCPNWKENIRFALFQQNKQDVKVALKNVKEARVKLKKMRESLLTAWKRKEATLQLFEMSLNASLWSTHTSLNLSSEASFHANHFTPLTQEQMGPEHVLSDQLSSCVFEDLTQ